MHKYCIIVYNIIYNSLQLAGMSQVNADTKWQYQALRDSLQTCAPCQLHSQGQFPSQHLQNFPDTLLAFKRQSIQDWPAQHHSICSQCNGLQTETIQNQLCLLWDKKWCCCLAEPGHRRDVVLLHCLYKQWPQQGCLPLAGIAVPHQGCRPARQRPVCWSKWEKKQPRFIYTAKLRMAVDSPVHHSGHCV